MKSPSRSEKFPAGQAEIEAPQMKNGSAQIAQAVVIAVLLLFVINPELRALLLVLQSIGTDVLFLWLVVVLRGHMTWLVAYLGTASVPASRAATLVVHLVAAQLYLRPFVALHSLLVPVLLARLNSPPIARVEA